MDNIFNSKIVLNNQLFKKPNGWVIGRVGNVRMTHNHPMKCLQHNADVSSYRKQNIHTAPMITQMKRILGLVSSVTTCVH